MPPVKGKHVLNVINAKEFTDFVIKILQIVNCPVINWFKRLV